MEFDMLNLKRAVRGDERAFEALIEPYADATYRLCLRMMGNEQDAADMAQEAFLRAWRSLSSYKGQSRFSTWLYRVTSNVCLDELRRGKRRKASSLDERIDAGWAPVDDMDTPEHHAMRTEQRRALERAIQELPEDMRSAVVLRDIQGCSYDEIADILGANVGTIKSRISRARARLREILSAQMELFDRPGV